jgi:endogenous inhibitor of DNA gyrase (YacG/DUF329 family)
MIKVRCPICDRLMEGAAPQDLPYLPFCSPRCRQIDLGRWLGEAYRLPAQEAHEESSAEGLEDQDPP